MTNVRSLTLSFSKISYPWLIVMCGMLFYCFNYFLRVSPSLMQNELTQTFHITATQFGALAAFYYYAYTLMQIPAGMIYDKFGARFVLCSACLIAVSGLSVFISADHYITAGIGRFMIGLGSAFAYIGTLKLASLWLPSNRFATVAGTATAAGMISGALSQSYLAKMVEMIGYKQALHVALISGLVLSAILVSIIRNRPLNQSSSHQLDSPINLKELLKALRIIFANPQMWIIGLIGCLYYLPSSVFLDLWGIPFLKSVYHLTPMQTVSIISYTFYGWVISGPIIGALSDKIQRRRPPLIIAGILATLLLCSAFYFPNWQLSSLCLIFFLVGVCCGAQSLCFALGKETNPIAISGTAVAVTNMLIMIGGVVCQPLVGKLLDLHTRSPVGADGLPVYTSGDYTFALSVVPIGVALGIILSFFLKETYCESQVKRKDEDNIVMHPAVSALEEKRQKRLEF